MANRARKKPVEVEYVQWTGENRQEVLSFSNKVLWSCTSEGAVLTISTLEGTMTASIGDYIIKGVEGEFYPCKPDIFHKTYEEVPQSELEAEIACYGAIREV